MACYDGFGNLADGRPFWKGDFTGDGRREILFYYPGDRNWWLGTFSGTTLTWRLAGNTSGFGQVADGRPFWVGDFTGGGKTDVLFYYPGDRNWWLGQFDAGGNLQWNLAGNTTGFGQVRDGRPFWTGDFTGDGKTDILFYYPGDRNWWLGRFVGTSLIWSLAGNTAGFGQVSDGRPFWVGDFSGDGKSEVLFYYPGDRNWWLGSFDPAGTLRWNLAGNTAGFGQVWDGRPFWTGDFSGDGKTDILFYYPGDRNWWRGRLAGGTLQWNLAGNTAGFGQVHDGRPFWVGDFAGNGRSDILFYYPGDRNWWLGRFDDAGALQWNLAGNTTGFGQVRDGRPFWTGDFTGDGKTDVLFYYPGDGNWWLGQLASGQLAWSHAGNTGRPFRTSVRVHWKILTQPTTSAATHFAALRDLFASAGILAVQGTVEDLTGDASLTALRDLDVGDCVQWFWPFSSLTAEQDQLYRRRANVPNDEVCVYYVNTLQSGSGNTIGCATHAEGVAHCVVGRNAPRHVVAHEVGHLLGLGHINDTNRLMNPDTGWTNLPPDIVGGEADTMVASGWTREC